MHRPKRATQHWVLGMNQPSPFRLRLNPKLKTAAGRQASSLHFGHGMPEFLSLQNGCQLQASQLGLKLKWMAPVSDQRNKSMGIPVPRLTSRDNSLFISPLTFLSSRDYEVPFLPWAPSSFSWFTLPLATLIKSTKRGCLHSSWIASAEKGGGVVPLSSVMSSLKRFIQKNQETQERRRFGWLVCTFSGWVSAIKLLGPIII